MCLFPLTLSLSFLPSCPLWYCCHSSHLFIWCSYPAYCYYYYLQQWSYRWIKNKNITYFTFMFFFSCRSKFLTDTIFLLPKEFLVAFHAEQICWWWILSVFVAWERLLKDNVTACRILGWWVFPWTRLAFHVSLLPCMVSDEKSPVILTFSQDFTPLASFKVSSLSLIVCYWNVTCPSVAYVFRLVFSELPGSAIWYLSFVLKSFQLSLPYRYIYFLFILSLLFWYSNYSSVTSFEIISQHFNVLF